MLGTPSRQSRGINPPVPIRRGEGSQMKWCWESQCSPRVRPVCRGNFLVASRVPSTVSHFKTERGTSLETLSRARASSCDDGGTTWFFSSCGRILELQRGIQASSCVVNGKSNLPLELRGRSGGCARVTAGQTTPHLGLCPGPNVPCQERQGSRGCIPDSPGESGLVSRGCKGLCSLLESRLVTLGAH